jgi:hypothetical protein
MCEITPQSGRVVGMLEACTHRSKCTDGIGLPDLCAAGWMAGDLSHVAASLHRDVVPIGPVCH